MARKPGFLDRIIAFLSRRTTKERSADPQTAKRSEEQAHLETRKEADRIDAERNTREEQRQRDEEAKARQEEQRKRDEEAKARQEEQRQRQAEEERVRQDKERIAREQREAEQKVRAAEEQCRRQAEKKGPALRVPEETLRFAEKLGIPWQITNAKDGTILLLVPAGKSRSAYGGFEVELPAYYLAAHAITNDQYLRFVQATGHRPPSSAQTGEPTWRGRSFPAAKADHPVVCVSWDDARKYCTWASLRLPTELEWEKAGGGPTGTRYPWGNDYDAKKCWAGSGWDNATSSIWSYPEGRSWWGHHNMVGAMWEWCQDADTGNAYARFRQGDLSIARADDRVASFMLRGGKSGCNERQALSRGSLYYCVGFRPALGVHIPAPKVEPAVAADEADTVEEAAFPDKRSQLMAQLNRFRSETTSFASAAAIQEIAALMQGFPESRAAAPMRQQILGDLRTYPMWEAAWMAIKSYVPWVAEYMSAADCARMSRTLLKIAARVAHWLEHERDGYVVKETR